MKKAGFAVGLLLAGTFVPTQAHADDTTVGFLPGVHTWTVPGGVTSIAVDAKGAEGGDDASSPAVPGLGGRVTATIAVTPGEELTVRVGAAGTTGDDDAGTGGGASGVSRGSTALVVAGGGGGAGAGYAPDLDAGGDGGAGGATGTAANGKAGGGTAGGCTGGGGGFGGANAGGAGSAGADTNPSNPNIGGSAGQPGVSFPGALAAGGDGGGRSGGGGGGGSMGGGGGGSGGGGDDAWNCAGGGGGGGSSFGGTSTPGVRSGNGVISITYTPLTFSDVGPDHPFGLEIAWLVDQGITNGFPDGTFRPTASVSRQALAAWLQQYVGEPFTPPVTPTFSDVPASHPFYAAIEWAASEGLVNGYSDGRFKPANPITRQAMATILWRLNNEPPHPPGPPSFTDVPATSLFYDAIEWAAFVHIANGFPDGTFRPTGVITRQSAAAFLFRYNDVVSV
jgi:hypothetical protein